MIDFINQVPSIYSESRDFQLLAKLYDAVLNLSKIYSDTAGLTYKSQIETLSELKARTNNFVPKIAWEENVLGPIADNFKLIMREKGTVYAIRICMNLLLRVFNYSKRANILILSKEDFMNDLTLKNDYYTDDISTNCVYVLIPKSIEILGLIQDIFRYILPIGVSYRIIAVDYLSEEFNDYINLIERGDNYLFRYIDDIYLPIVGSINDGGEYVTSTADVKVNVINTGVTIPYPNIPATQINYNIVVNNNNENYEEI